MGMNAKTNAEVVKRIDLPPQKEQWKRYQLQYASGDYRACVFRDIIIDELRGKSSQQEELTVVDIGCGGGFDGHPGIQREIAAHAKRYIGVEPDTEIELPRIFSETFRCTIEKAPVEPASVDVAFAVMVLEHIEVPELFWQRVRDILKPGGVFWGFTINAQHWFATASLAFDKLRIKDAYLNALHGKRGEERYENYGVYYRINHPDVVLAQTQNFARAEVIDFQKIGQLDYYFPLGTKWISRALARLERWRGKPGNVMAIRVVR